MRASDEKRYGGKGKVGKNGENSSGSKGKLVTFSPTKEQKDDLKSGIIDEAKAVEVLDRCLMEGNKVSLGFSQDRNGFFAIVREGGQDWQKCISVSVWAGTLARAIVVLGYYLREVNPEFPNSVQLPLFDDEW